MRKVLLMAGALLGSLASFAEGETNTEGIDLAPVTTALTDMKGALVDWAGDALPILMIIGGAFLTFWLGRFIFGLIKGIGSKAK